MHNALYFIQNTSTVHAHTPPALLCGIEAPLRIEDLYVVLWLHLPYVIS